MSGARRVYAITADSAYATSADVEVTTMEAAATAGVADRVLVTTRKSAKELGESDIVTNSGFVRPIDATTLGWMKPTAVVPLMWETWEFRSSDLDLDACRALGILVMGTDEGRPPFPMYSYVGLLALKLLFELGLEGLRTRVLLLGGGKMGEAITDVLNRCGAHVTCVAGDAAYDRLAETRPVSIEGFDAVICAEHENPRKLIGEGGVLRGDDLVARASALRVGVIAGNVDGAALVEAGIRYFPARIRPYGFMSYQPYSLGPQPVLELFASGLKVGWAMATARLSGMDLAAAQRFALDNSPAMAFGDGVFA